MSSPKEEPTTKSPSLKEKFAALHEIDSTCVDPTECVRTVHYVCMHVLAAFIIYNFTRVAAYSAYSAMFNCRGTLNVCNVHMRLLGLLHLMFGKYPY